MEPQNHKTWEIGNHGTTEPQNQGTKKLKKVRAEVGQGQDKGGFQDLTSVTMILNPPKLGLELSREFPYSHFSSCCL